MARNSGRSSSGFGSRSSSSSSRSASPRPSFSSNQTRSAPQQPASTAQSRTPIPQPSSGGMMSGIGSTIVSGMAFGAGSEIAHQAVRSVMGGGSHNQAPQQQQQQPIEGQNNQVEQKPTPCADFNYNFVHCLKVNDNSISTCQGFFDDLKACEKNII